MHKSNLKKIAGIGIVFVFILSACTPLSGGTSRNTASEIPVSEPATNLQAQEATITCQTFGLSGENNQHITTLTMKEAEQLNYLIQELQKEIVKEPGSVTVDDLQQHIFSFAHDHHLLPEEITLDVMQSPMQKILSKNPIDNPLPWPYRGTELFCNYVSTGEGSALPIIVLPRLVPILLTPIPRAFFAWDTYEGITSCGGLLSRTGFIAYGNQRGLALGFWGIGFSIFLPPVMAYGIIGYALYCRVDADHMEYYPPNYPPEVNAVYPLDEAINIPIETDELQFFISDQNKDSMSYSVITDPYVGGGNANNKPDGSYTIPISGLEGSETYTWTVQVSDGANTVEETYSFSTEPVAPVVSNPSPEDEERYVPVSLSELRFHLRDLQGDPMDYTVETSPDIGSGSGMDVGDGYYTVPVSGLDHMTEYRWYVNVTDGLYWKHAVFSFQTEPIMVFNPFEEGWQYRKNISIDHTKVAGDLQNFPVLISLIDTDLRDKAQDDGDDLLFMDGTGAATRLYHEIEKYDGLSGELVAWVNITDVASNQDTILYMYYGNPSSCNQQIPELVWDTNFLTVQHLNEPFGNIIDSTFNGEDGSKNGNPAYLQDGKVGNCIRFDPSSNDYFSFSDINFRISSGMAEFWFNAEESPIYFGGKEIYGPWADGIKLILNVTNHLRLRFDSSIGSYMDLGSNDFVELGLWNHVVFQWGSQGMKLYVNGNLQANTNPYTGGVICAGKNFEIGRYNSNREMNGYIDELRVTTTIRDASWVKTSCDNQNNPTGFLSFGPEETGP